ncbi:MAG: HEAT repeat domain-containing protein, partial [Thermoanaerobaculia bacterium]|nr:HEAT repeat domain-containing protein [Thermoanaerobaculia bacterium]
MRRLLFASTLILASCATSVQKPGTMPPPAEGDFAGEAVILRLEDRREYDRAVALEWSRHADSMKRERIARALGRIGTASFDDANGNGRREPGEPMAGVALLIELANDPVADVRRSAAFAMGEIGDPSSIDALFGLTGDADAAVAAAATDALTKIAASVPFDRFQSLTTTLYPAEVRSVAIRYLFRFGTDEASGTAAMLLESRDTSTRVEACYALSRRAFAPARRKLEMLLADGDALVRAHSARALGLIAAEDSLRALSAALEDPHPWVRINAARSIGQVIDKNPERLSSEVASAAATRLIALTADPDPGTRATAVEILGRFTQSSAQAKDRLDGLANGDERWAREVAALALARAGLVDSSSKLVEHESPWVRARILEGTSTLPQGAAIRARLASSPDALVRVAAIGAIPEQPADSDSRLLLAALDDPDVVVRASAIGRLSADPYKTLVSRERLVAIEESSRRDTHNDARVAAVELIATIEDAGRAAWLAALLKDPDPVVRRIAAESLERIEKVRYQYTPLAIERPLAEYESIARWASQPRSATIRMARGDIDLILFTREAPTTAWNFARLAEQGYFDGTTFMRVVPNFVLQGGDPRNDMSGGPGYAIRDEINEQRYSRGAVGMALSGPDTGGSQFFVTHSPQPHLDGGYTVFGHVVAGMGGVADLVERGERVDTILVDAKRLDPAGIAGVSQTTLPTVVGETAAGRLLDIVPEYRERKEAYAPDPDTLAYLASVIQPGDRLEVFLGTWCDDSQREIPKLLRIVDGLAVAGAELPLRLVSVDRTKRMPADLVAGKELEKVS